MPSAKASPGEIQERKDVNPSEESSVSDEPKTQAREVPEEKSAAPEVDESDLQALEEQKKVPYARFKEKVDETKTLKQRLAEMEQQTQFNRSRAEEDAEIRVRARLEKEREAASMEDLDPTERRVRSTDSKVSQLESELRDLRSQSEHQAAQASIERLERKYPKADSLAVLGWAKARGIKANSEGMEDLMEASHNKTIEHAQAAIKEMLEHKKSKAKSAVPTREGGIRLKDGERPKNLKEAMALTRRYYGDSDG